MVQAEIESIQNMSLNMFTNTGYILPFVVSKISLISSFCDKTFKTDFFR